MSDALNFLTALWGDKPDTTAVQVWRKSDHKNFYFRNLVAASDWVVSNNTGDVYMAAGLAAKEVKSNKNRATAKTVVGIPGVWADIDVNGGPEGKTGAAPSVEEAISLAEHMLSPTLLVNSGYGVQAWWLFDGGAWPFYTEEDRDTAQKIVTGFQGALKSEARKRGYTIDSTFDLARLMRVPGSLNHKGGKEAEVTLLDDGGPRYPRERLEEVGQDFQATSASRMQLLTGEAVQIEIRDNAQPPMDKMELLRDVVEEFNGVWKHVSNRDRTNWSMSEYEFSITNYFVKAGWTDQEICDALVFHRNYYEPGDPKRKNRADRIAATIGKIRATTEYKAEQKYVEQQREEATDQLAAISGDAGLDPVVTISLFNRVIGGPEVKQVVQQGTDYDLVRYKLELANGDEIVFAPEEFFDQARFRRRFAVKTRHLPPTVKGNKWDEVIRALLDAATIKEEAEDTRSHRAIEWLRSYCDRRLSSDRDMACQSYDPFVDRGRVHVPLGPLHQFLRKIRGERISDVDLKHYLEVAGFERKTVNYKRDNGKQSTRSYYVAPEEVMGGDVL